MHHDYFGLFTSEFGGFESQIEFVLKVLIWSEYEFGIVKDLCEHLYQFVSLGLITFSAEVFGYIDVRPINAHDHCLCLSSGEYQLVGVDDPDVDNLWPVLKQLGGEPS